MQLLRAAARAMLASFFVVNGVNSIRKPEDFVDAAEPIARFVVPAAQRMAPPSAAHYIPTDTATLVRVSGAAQVAGGLMLATGLLRRLGAATLTASMVPHVLASNPLRAASGDRPRVFSQFVRNLALLGGVLLAAQDTEGKPGIAWRLDDKRKDLSASAERASKKVAKTSRRMQRQAKKAAKKVQDQLS